MKIFFSILIFSISTLAQAEILLEPYLGYNFPSKIVIEREDNSSGHGRSLGGRAGFQKLGFQIGADYSNSSISMSDEDFDSLSINEFAGFVGFEFPFLVRVYAGYIFAASANSKYDDGSGSGKEELELSGGSGRKFGIGFTGIPYICLNFEYREVQFGEYSLGNTDVGDKVDFNSYLLTISLPFVF